MILFKKNHLVLLFILFLQSCSDNKNQIKEVFITKYSVDSKVVIKSDKLLDPNIIEVLDSKIIIGNYKGEPLVEVHDLSKDTVIKVVDKGRGPNEIAMVGRIQVDHEKKKFYINDLFVNKVIECKPKNNGYELKLMFNSSHFKKREGINYDKVLIGDDVFIGENRSVAGRLVVMDEEGEVKKAYFDFPDKKYVNPKLGDYGNAKLYASAVAINPKLDKLAMVTYSAGMIDLIEIKDKELLPIWSYNEFYPTGIKAYPMGGEIVPMHTEKSRKGYIDVCTTDDYVYALFSGKVSAEKKLKYSSVVRVMNWQANQFFEINLDRDIKRFSVSQDNRQIYGVSKNENGKPEILVFEISQLFKKE